MSIDFRVTGEKRYWLARQSMIHNELAYFLAVSILYLRRQALDGCDFVGHLRKSINLTVDVSRVREYIKG